VDNPSASKLEIAAPFDDPAFHVTVTFEPVRVVDWIWGALGAPTGVVFVVPARPSPTPLLAETLTAAWTPGVSPERTHELDEAVTPAGLGVQLATMTPP